ncbi:unnamed protein product, partial [marine sediment metagenome]
VGNVFFVDTAANGGNNGNHGRTMDQPLLTITEALDRCAYEHNDVIIILNYWTPAGEAWPIVVNKRQVHIIGAAMWGLPFPAIVPDGDHACFQFDEAGCYSEIAFLTIGGGAAHGGIELSVDNQAEGVWIHDCYFGHSWFGLPQNGIWLSPGGVRHTFGCRIERCTFMGDQGNFVGALTEQGILQSGAGGAYARDLEILNNVFKGVAVGIELARGFDAVIKGNRFGIDDGGGADQAIDLGAACLGCLIDDNHVGTRMAASSTSAPFSDQTGPAGVVNGVGF